MLSLVQPKYRKNEVEKEDSKEGRMERREEKDYPHWIPVLISNLVYIILKSPTEGFS